MCARHRCRLVDGLAEDCRGGCASSRDGPSAGSVSTSTSTSTSSEEEDEEERWCAGREDEPEEELCWRVIIVRRFAGAGRRLLLVVVLGPEGRPVAARHFWLEGREAALEIDVGHEQEEEHDCAAAKMNKCSERSASRRRQRCPCHGSPSPPPPVRSTNSCSRTQPHEPPEQEQPDRPAESSPSSDTDDTLPERPIRCRRRPQRRRRRAAAEDEPSAPARPHQHQADHDSELGQESPKQPEEPEEEEGELFGRIVPTERQQRELARQRFLSAASSTRTTTTTTRTAKSSWRKGCGCSPSFRDQLLRIPPYLATLLILSYSFIGMAEACSSRSTPKPRPPAPPTPRPNITFHMFTCPPDYDEWYCLNGATCFTVKIVESLLYNCLCSNGYIGQRCEFKDLDGSYLPSRQRVMLETASIAGAVTIAVFLAVITFISVYIHCKRKQKELRMSVGQDAVDSPCRVPELRPFCNRNRSLMIFMGKQAANNSTTVPIEQTMMPSWNQYPLESPPGPTASPATTTATTTTMTPTTTHPAPTAATRLVSPGSYNPTNRHYWANP